MVSAVILQHGLHAMTRVALDSLRASAYPLGEIIVVDNASPLSDEWLGSVMGARVVSLGRNLGYQGGTNAGWKAARGEYALLCNNDIALSRACVWRLVAAMESDPDLGWVSACYQKGGWPAATVIFPAEVAEQLNTSLGADQSRLNAWSGTLTPDLHICEVTEATVILVRREVRDTVGLFDESLVYHHAHDYGMRLKAAGWKAAVERSAVFWHNPNHPTLAIVPTHGTREQRAESDEIMAGKWGGEWKALAQ